jgi:hypothetical protein
LKILIGLEKGLKPRGVDEADQEDSLEDEEGRTAVSALRHRRGHVVRLNECENYKGHGMKKRCYMRII